ncbi:Cytochrome P450 [Musa troglodytarum]|uniref:Cytochrome P450 n=1 Tax=Musa troglodytarum TaxID=320322 RepID=A0A9E7KB12_9LILI|nr:Cytochrome P450 [Musa troglodytarum]
MGWSWKWWLCLGVIGASVFVALEAALEFLWWRPKRLEKHFARQGIRGPPYRFFIGSVNEMVGMMLEASSEPMTPQTSHDILPRVLPFYHYWKKIYGSTFLLWFGPTARLTVADPDLIREIFLSRSDVFERYESHPLVRQLEGEGLVSLRGEKWAHHRRVLAPTFHMENLKSLMPFIAKTVLGMVENLAASGEEAEIDVSEWFQTVTEAAITRTAFGSRCYEEGKAIFHLQTQQMVFAAEAFRKVFIPGYRFLPTKRNTNSWRLEKEIRRSLIRLIGRRKERAGEEKPDGGNPKDLLDVMINASTMAAPRTSTITVRDIVEECKTFFFAGKQTTSNLLTWATVLLAMHPEWQERARDEVLRVCGADGNDTERDATAVPAGGGHDTAGEGGHGAGRPPHPPRHRAADPHHRRPPRRRSVGPGRGPVQPRAVRGRGEPGGAAPGGLSPLRPGRPDVHRPEPGPPRGQAHSSRHPPALRPPRRPVVRPRAYGPDAPPPAARRAHRLPVFSSTLRSVDVDGSPKRRLLVREESHLFSL